jgi:membrane protease subunit HflK
MSPRTYEDRGWPSDRAPDAIRWLTQYGPLTVLGILLLFLLWNSYYTVAAHEQAVVLRFGKYRATEGPGLHFMIPLVDRVARVSIAERSIRMPFGVTVGGEVQELDENRVRQQQESLILTGDLYAAVVEWNVNWRVSEPRDFLFSIHADQVERTITAVARSMMHRSVGDYSADETLTGKREEIGLAALKEMQQALDHYQCGVSVVALQMQRVTPPERVKPAFDEVNASIQQREQLVSEANRERNRLIPQAEATRDRLTRQAEGYAARKRAESDGEIFALRAKYLAYKEAPDITRRRLYLEAFEEVIKNSGPKVVLDADLRNLLPLLNLAETQAVPSGKR